MKNIVITLLLSAFSTSHKLLFYVILDRVGVKPKTHCAPPIIVLFFLGDTLTILVLNALFRGMKCQNFTLSPACIWAETPHTQLLLHRLVSNCMNCGNAYILVQGEEVNMYHAMYIWSN